MMRYVDDSNTVSDEIPPRARFERRVIKIKPEHVEEDRLIPADLRTAKVAKDVANSLFSFIQMEIDCPSMHDSNLVPILDLLVS